MAIPPNVQDFWNAFVAQTCNFSEARFYEAFAFGDSKELANSLADLVMRGTKRATAGSLWAFEVENKALPKPGDLSVVTDWDGNPQCVIETTSVDIVPFAEAVSSPKRNTRFNELRMKVCESWPRSARTPPAAYARRA